MSLPKRIISLQWKILIQIIIVSVICLAISGFFITRWVVSNIQEEHLEKIQVLSKGGHVQDMLKEMDTRNQKRISNVKIRLYLVFSAITLILCVILWWSVRVRVVVPVKGILKRVMMVMNDFKLFQPLEIVSMDEIGKLEHSFNKLVEKLREKIDEIGETRDFLNRIMMSMEEGIVVLGKDYRIVMANDFLLKLTGLGKEDVIGMKCYIAFHGLEKECQECNLEETFKTGISSTVVRRCKNKKSDGDFFDVEVYYYPVFDKEGKVIYVIESVKDISEKLKYEEDLSRAEKLAAVGTLAAGVAHEIGNPLASISSLAETIERKSSDRYIKEEINVMASHIERISKIVRDLVDFSRPANYEFRMVQINDVIRDTVRLCKYDKKLEKIDIVTVLSDDLPDVRTVREKLVQIFMNLIWNAADAVSVKNGNGNIVITTDTDSGMGFKITFSDNGMGMSGDEMSKIFEPFYSTKSSGKGTGLGLFVSYGIIRNLGGNIEVESEKGKGSKFTVTLPVEDKIDV